MNRILRVLYPCFLAVALGSLAAGQTQPSPPAAQKVPVPVMDGGAGPCSCELTVLAPDGRPAAAAIVKVHIAYGFGGFHRLDLEAGTNSDGKVRFTGLPAKVKLPPLEFHASKEELTGTATYDPAVECQAKHDIGLEKPTSSPK